MSQVSLCLWASKVGSVTVNIQGAATDEHPVLYDIFYLVQYLLDIKGKFIPPVNCRLLIKQNGNKEDLLNLITVLLKSSTVLLILQAQCSAHSKAVLDDSLIIVTHHLVNTNCVIIYCTITLSLCEIYSV